MNKTKTIVTVGANTASKEMLKSLIINGADVVRLNMGHATFDFCSSIINTINEINNELNTYTAIMIDTKGPLVRVGKLVNSTVFLKQNDKIRIYMNPVLGDSTKFSIDYNLIKEISINDIIKINDNNVELEVLEKGYDYLLCNVSKEGYINEFDSINIPNVKLNKEFLSDYDKKIIKFASENKVDFISLSYVSSYDDVLEVNDLLINLKDEHIQIISKIENESAVSDIDRIIKASDGIMIVRGDLGCEIPIERIPGIQKKIISKCHTTGTISIVATELLSTMVNSDRPTKAEVSDIANAVLDGTDAVMLCGETTIGKYPVETLKMMEKIIRAAEKDINYDYMINQAIKTEDIDITGSLAYSVSSCAEKLNCKAIFAPTMSGYTAKKMSRFRPFCPIIAISPSIKTVKSLALNFGVYPILINDLNTFDEIIEKSKKIAIEFLLLQKNDKIIITGGYPFKTIKHTNFMKIEEI